MAAVSIRGFLQVCKRFLEKEIKKKKNCRHTFRFSQMIDGAKLIAHHVLFSISTPIFPDWKPPDFSRRFKSTSLATHLATNGNKWLKPL